MKFSIYSIVLISLFFVCVENSIFASSRWTVEHGREYYFDPTKTKNEIISKAKYCIKQLILESDEQANMYEEIIRRQKAQIAALQKQLGK